MITTTAFSRSRPFGAAADGIVPGEGGAALVLARMDDALRDGDPVLALVRGTAVNNDGRSLSLLAPSSHWKSALSSGYGTPQWVARARGKSGCSLAGGARRRTAGWSGAAPAVARTSTRTPARHSRFPPRERNRAETLPHANTEFRQALK